ncbi:MAG: GspH/FimT family pseudopilin [Agarilytica sp.]
MNTKTSQGFTLLELLVSVAIVAIVAFIAVPNLAEMVNKNRVETTKSTLVNSIVSARSEAVSRNLSVGLCPTTNGTSCGTGGDDLQWLAFADEDGDESFDAGETILGVYQGEEGVNFETEATGLLFFADGSVGASVVFNVCSDNTDPADTYKVTIRATGRPSVERPGECDP